MARVIIASKSDKLVSTVRALIVGDGHDVAAIAMDAYDLKRQVKAYAPNVVVIDDEINSSVVSIIESLLFEQQAVLLIGKSHQKSYYQQSPYFELCEKPLQPNILLMTLRLLVKYSQTVRNLESRINKLEEKQKAERIIQKAKRGLQQFEKMSEEEAHHYIQRRSMELRVSKLEFAHRIIKRFEKNG